MLGPMSFAGGGGGWSENYLSLVRNYHHVLIRNRLRCSDVRRGRVAPVRRLLHPRRPARETDPLGGLLLEQSLAQGKYTLTPVLSDAFSCTFLKNILENISPFCGVIDTSVLNIW